MVEAREHEAPTRRDYLKGTGVAIGSGLLAGCSGDNPDGTRNETSPKNGTNAAKETAETDEPYSVSLSPMGSVSFDAVPESAFVVFPQYADMAVALGHGDAVNALYVPEMSGTTMNRYYDRLDGVSFDWKGLPDPLEDGLNREMLYKLDSDVHFADPAYVSTQGNWSRDDAETIRKNVGPWFGNFYSGTHASPPSGYRSDYRYYTLWELFGKVARVFRAEQRYRAIERIHSNLLSTIRGGLPPKDERPTAVRVTLAAKSDAFYTYHLNKPGYWLADTRPLGANDAFADEEWSNLWGTVDYETMAEADPDVILHLWGITPNYSIDEIRRSLENNSIGKRLSAVQNDRVYASGMRYQGPIMNCFQLEMTAKQLYPEQFGEWPGYVSGQPYPEIPGDEQLFDRDRLSKAIRGEL